MAIRFLLPLAVISLASLVRANESLFLDPEIVMERYEAGPLECYSKNNVTGAVSLQICRHGQQDTDGNVMPIAGYPACMMFKRPNRAMQQTCIYLPSPAVLDCGKGLCTENKHVGGFSECCCTTSGCNGHMVPRPKAVLELPDDE